MKSFKEFLLESMTVQDAFRILNIDPNTEYDLKRAFRSASKLSHPDLGGSDEQQKQVNLAYELLQKKKGKIENGIERGSKDWWDKKNKETEMKVKIVDTLLKNNFDKQKFLDYFSKFTTDELFVKEVFSTITKYSTSASHNYTFQNKDKTTVFYLQISGDASNITGSIGSGKGVEFPLYTENYLYHNKRKQKMEQRTWNFKNNLVSLSPEKLFPAKILKEVFGGKKQRKFSKRDMIQGFKRELDANFSNDYVYIPITDNIKFLLWRTVMMKQAAWTAHSLQDKSLPRNSMTVKVPWVTFMESEESLSDIIELVKKLKKLKDSKKIETFITKYLNDRRKKNMNK